MNEVWKRIFKDWVETYEDTFGCTFESGCIFGLEDTEPTEEELMEFEAAFASSCGPMWNISNPCPGSVA